LLSDLARIELEQAGGPPVSDHLHIETRIASEDNALEAGIVQLGQLSPFTCPDCHGTLLQITDGYIRL
jgi:two-component system chemotaxis response regulator CheB